MIRLLNQLIGPASTGKAVAASSAVHVAGLLAMAAWTVSAMSEVPRFSGQTHSSSVVILMSAAEPIVEQVLQSEGPVIVTPQAAQIASQRFTYEVASAVGTEPFDEVMSEALRRFASSTEAPSAATPPRAEAGDGDRPDITDDARPVERMTLISQPQLAGTDDRSPPDFTGNRPPSYPLLARQRGWEGTVLLRLAIGADGQVKDVEVVRSSGHAVLDAAAANAVRSWRGRPARIGGLPAESVEHLPVRFSLR